MAALALLALPGCSSLGDLGYVQQPAVADNIHAWVGQEAAARAGAPISLANLTEDERTLRDLAFPLIEPAYDRDRWDAVVYEYGQKREFQRNLWIVDPSAYYRELLAADYRSTAGRYNRLNDDIRNDVVRIGPFFYIAHRVIEADDGVDPRRFTARAVQRLGEGLGEQSHHRLGGAVAGAAMRELPFGTQSFGGLRA